MDDKKVVIVTGAQGSLGRAAAQALAKHGCFVVDSDETEIKPIKYEAPKIIIEDRGIPKNKSKRKARHRGSDRW